MDYFIKECDKYYRCFVEYCRDNVSLNGELSGQVVCDALIGFAENIDIAYKIAKAAESIEVTKREIASEATDRILKGLIEDMQIPADMVFEFMKNNSLLLLE